MFAGKNLIFFGILSCLDLEEFFLQQPSSGEEDKFPVLHGVMVRPGSGGDHLP